MTKRKSGTTKIDHTQNNKNVYTDSFCALNSDYSDLSWQNSQVGTNAKDTTDCIAANCYLLTKYDDVYVPYKTWDSRETNNMNPEKIYSNIENLLSKEGFFI